MTKPIIIVFEGIDGSGKTTQAKLLNDYLNKIGVKSTYSHIFDSSGGQKLREFFLNNELSNIVEILILCAARQAYLDEKLKTFDKYDVIILDRFFLSIQSMQGQNETAIELIDYLKNVIGKKIEAPNVFFIETLPSECRRRIIHTRECDRIENKGLEFHENVAKRYLELLNKEQNAYIFNGNNDIFSIHKHIVDKALELLDYSYCIKTIV